MATREAPPSCPPPPGDEGFAAALATVAGVAGWLTPEQTRRLWDRARALAPGATIVEIGSFHGRSTIVLARARPLPATVIAIDPHAGSDRLPQTPGCAPEEGEQDHRAFHENLRRAGVADRVRHVRCSSQQALPAVGGDVDLLFIDGAHRYQPCRADIEQWGARVSPGGTMLLHDAFNAVGVTMAQVRVLLISTGWSYRGRSGSLAEYRREPMSATAVLTNAFRQLAEAGYFMQSLAIKAALARRRPKLARRLGHRIDGWPH